MGGDRVHAHRGVADQGETLAREPAAPGGGQGIGAAFADQFQPGQPSLQPPLHLDRKGLGRQAHQVGDGRGGQGQDDGGDPLINVRDRQQGDGLAVVEPFGGDMAVRLVVAHPADHHRPAQPVHLDPDAQLVAHAGKAGIRRHDQPGPDRRPIVQHDPAARGGALDGAAGHSPPRHQDHARLAFDNVEQGAADQVVGDQDAQPVGAADVEGQGEGRAAVQHPRLAQVRNLFGRNPVPGAEGLQQADGVVGQGDLAPVEGRVAQGGLTLALDQSDAQSGSSQGPGEGQARRSGPDHGHVEHQIIAHAELLIFPCPSRFVRSLIERKSSRQRGRRQAAALATSAPSTDWTARGVSVAMTVTPWRNRSRYSETSPSAA